MKIYFMGICGTAMGNVATLMRDLGHTVLGADTNTYPPMSTHLQEAGVEVFQGYDPERLQSLSPDRIVVGNVIPRGNPELEYLLNTSNPPILSLPELISQELLKNRPRLVITGTHGKTTTTTIAAYLLEQLGKSPGYLIGGLPLDLPSGATTGAPGTPFVIEGDEYDSAFFDKRSKFIHYKPNILTINNLEFDHADIFRDLQDVQRSFSHLLRTLPSSGHVLINADDPNTRELLPVPWTQVHTVGVGDAANLHISNFTETASTSSFTLTLNGKHWADIAWPLPGLYNARNAAMAALAVALELYPEDPTALDLGSLKTFKGVQRRQQVLHQDPNHIVISDFAHHPTAIEATLQSLKNRYPDHHVLACLEPRSNTLCLNTHQEALQTALLPADTAYLAPVYRAGSYKDHERLNTHQLAAALPDAQAFDDFPSLLTTLHNKTQMQKTCTVFLSNGAFGGLIQDFLHTLNLSTA